MKISVIMSVFNGEKYLSRSVESFLNQDYQNKELIIIDGKSTDNSHNIISSYQEKYYDIIKWINTLDNGISHSRNIAVKYASGDIVGFLGVDDIIHKDFFKNISYYIEINPYFDVIHFDGYSINQNSNSYFSLASNINFTKRNLIKFQPINSGERFYYKKEIFNQFSFNENNKYSMDYEFNMALVSSKNKYRFYGVNIPSIFNVSDGNNISNLLSNMQRAESSAVQIIYCRSFLEKIRLIARRPKFFLKNRKLIKLFLRNLKK